MRACTIWIAAAGLLIPGACKQTTAHAGGKAITITKPADQTITQGGSEPVTVHISRSQHSDPVTVHMTGLPAGVSVAEADKRIASDQTSAVFTLIATPTAAVVNNHSVKVTADGPEGLAVSETFLLTVKEKR